MSRMASLQNFFTFLQSNQKSFMNGLLILVTLGSEQIVKASEVFQCPCDNKLEAQWYACSFIFGPAVVLIIIGVVVNNLTWHLCHGCCKRSKNCTHGYCKALEHCFVIFARACIVPCAWIFLLFLDGKYYVCLKSDKPCEKNSDENKHLVGESQFISWMFLVSVVGLSTFIVCIVRCTDSMTFLENKYASVYREVEAEYFETKIKIAASGLAKTNVDKFMSKPKITKEDWDAISKAPEHRIRMNAGPLNMCPVGSPNNPGTSYTPLHDWNKKTLLSEPFVPANVCIPESQGQTDENVL